MELVGRLLISNNKLYRVSEMSVSGVLKCILLKDMLKINKIMYELDPLTSVVKDTCINVIDMEEFSREELSFLSDIDKYLAIEEVIRIIGYRSEYSRYLFVVYCNNNIIHIIDIGQNDIYGLILNNGKVFLPEDLFNRYDIKEDVTKHYLNVSWTKSARFFKMNYQLSPNVVETIGRLFHNIRYYEKVDFPLLKNCSGGYCLKIENEDGYLVDKEDNILKQLYYREIGLSLLSEYMESYYNYPSIRLDEDELEKVKGILESYGYTGVYNRLKEFNGIQSNFVVKDGEESVCIKDSGIGHIYSLHKLKLCSVVSSNGIPMYYEIRMYPLCGSDSYIVVYSSVSRKNCESLLRLKYGNLIRGRLLKIKKYPYEVTSVVDTSTTISIRYTIRDSKRICEGVYNKKFGMWEQKSKFDEGDIDFLWSILAIFDKIANVRSYVQEKYSVYRVIGNRFCLERHFCIGSSSSFQGSKNIINNFTGDKFLIVKWVEDVNEGMWMFSKKDKAIIKVS